MFKVARRTYAAVLPLIFSLAWIPLQAFAQLPLPCVPGLTCPNPDTTPPTVSITSPASGATVSGTIAVTANASDNVGVAGVQFKLDGANLGAEDATAPYSIPWDTTTTGNGSHTLTAVARDTSGNQTTSNPVAVTVSNTPPPSVPVTRYEETDPSVSYSAVGWVKGDSGWPWSGGTAAYSTTPGAQVTFTFTGTSVTWLGYRSGYTGVARVSVDGVFVSDVDLFARTDEIRVPALTVSGLTNSSHTLTIQVTGMKNPEAVNNGVLVDAFDVPGPPVSRLQDTDPSITYTAGWTPGDTSLSWSDRLAHVATTAGAQATLPFNGTSITWIGFNGPNTGIANVYLDGSFVGQVDTYSPTGRVQNAVFTATGLADASHTLTIESTGLKNDASTGTLIAVDAFDVTSPGTRFEETDWRVAYSGDWIQDNVNHAWSQGSIAESTAAGAQATFTFTGTSVKWIGFRGPSTGIARVYLDGSYAGDIDTYASTEGRQDTIFTATGLASGSHTLTIEVTGQKNPAAANYWVVVDAFDVRP